MNRFYQEKRNKNKFFAILIMALTVLQVCYAQDVIVLKNGNTIQSKIIEVGKTDIKYKKWSNIDGPNYVLSISDILSINYQNGDKETFIDIQKEKNDLNNYKYNNSDTTKINCSTKAEEDNIELIKLYNKVIALCEEKESKKIATNGLCKFGITCNSVLSSKDLEISIERLPKWAFCCQYGIAIKNKTHKTIYIDLGNSFKIKSNSTYEVYFDDTKQISVTNGNGNGIALGLGSVANAIGVGGLIGNLAQGVTLGQKSENSVSINYSKQRILAIPPLGKCFLSEHKEVGTKKNIEYISHGEQFFMVLKKGMINKGASLQYTEDDSPWKQNYIITYSDNETFSTYRTLEFSIYIQQIFGVYMQYIYNLTPNQITDKINEMFNTDCQNLIIEKCIFLKDIECPRQL